MSDALYMGLSPEEVITKLKHVQLFQFIDVASVMLYVYDYSLTFQLEVEHIWPSKCSFTNVMFYITRYLPFVESAILLYRTFSLGLSVPTCYSMYRASTVLILVGVIIAEVILTMRTWSVWERSKKLGIGLAILTVALAVPAIPVLVIFSGTAKFVDPPTPNFRGCFLMGGGRILSLDWILLMIYDGVLSILMAIQGYRISKTENNPYILTVVVRDGLIYYFNLFVLSACNIIIIWTLPPDFVNLLTMLERFIHSIFTCRVILHMREYSRRPSTTFFTTGTNMEFEEQYIPA